jgi:formylglycine-generating enzyme required for sulfatase activity
LAVRVLAIIFCALSMCWASAAPAEKRVALLIGNQNYAREVGPLANPLSDVALIEAALKKLGFAVTVLIDARYRDMDVAVKRYAAELRRAGPGAVGFFYYSGHGAANADTRTNYLIPVDVTNAEDESVWYGSIQQNAITDLLNREAPAATQFVVFDACRNELHLSSGAAKAIGADKGFVPVAQTAGLMIAYATAPNRTASDAGKGGGVYAKALADELVKPGVEAVTMFRNVHLRVKQTIGQDPWLSIPSLAEVFLAGRDAPQPQSPDEVAKLKEQLARLEEALKARETKPSEEAALRERLERLEAELQKKQQLEAAKPVTKKEAFAAPPKPAVSEDACEDGLRVSVGLSGEKPCIVPGSGKAFRDCPDCPEMVPIPAGSFLMGSPEGEDGRFSDEGPQHKVTIAQPFAVGRSHVTRAQFAKFMRASGHKAEDGCYTLSGGSWKEDKAASWRAPGFDQDDDHPVVCVNWNDATAYAAWLRKTTGQPYRLLSEAEAEYASRGVTKATAQPRYFFGNDEKDLCKYANGADETAKESGKLPSTWTYSSCRDGYVFTAPAMSFKPNAFGLYDVHGNAWTWTQDCWVDNYKDASTDGSAWTGGDCSRRVLRGGSWDLNPRSLRAADRSRGYPGIRSISIGFRLARTLNP